jgi:hypothetical protein
MFAWSFLVSILEMPRKVTNFYGELRYIICSKDEEHVKEDPSEQGTVILEVLGKTFKMSLKIERIKIQSILCASAISIIFC